MKRSGAWVAGAVVVLLATGASPPPEAPEAVELGRGPTVVLIHGLGGTRTTWMPTVRKLMGSHRVVLVDLPGHGESPLPDPFSLEAAAEALDGVLAAQKAESTIVVGQGMGGVVGLLAVAAHPERARGLVLIDAALLSPPDIPAQQRGQVLQLLDMSYDFFIRRMFTAMGRDSAQGVTIHAQASQVPSTTMKAYFAQLLNVDATEAVRKAAVPILALGTERVWPASRDSLAFAKQMGYLDAPRLTLRRMRDCGLLVATEQPDSLAALLAGFSARSIATR